MIIKLFKANYPVNNMDKKIKILEICPFSVGICGVWTRVLSESLEFIKLGYEVRVFSSDIIKGTDKRVDCDENVDGIKIKRFSSSKSFISKNVNNFNFEEEFLDYKPKIVITHLLHPHSFKALKLCRKYNIPCYLVTHAPFNVKRRFPLNLATSFYNTARVKPFLKKFTKIIAITRWEMPYLKNLGIKEDKIICIPNGIPNEFFNQNKPKSQKTKDVLFLGRIAPVKNIETLLFSAKVLPNVGFSIVGSSEEKYLEKLNETIEKEQLKNVRIFPPIYNLKKKIQLIDEHKIFVLPSFREAMPQVLLEAMARGLVVIASNTDGANEIIINEKTGFLFKVGDSKRLAELISLNLSGNKTIENNAINESKKYLWQKLIKLYSSMFNK